MASILKMARLAPILRAGTLQRPAAILITERHMTNFKDKERGEETVHFRKADEELLRKLLQKVVAALLPGLDLRAMCLRCDTNGRKVHKAVSLALE